MNATRDIEVLLDTSYQQSEKVTSLVARIIRARVKHFVVLFQWVVSFGDQRLSERVLLSFVAGMVNLNCHFHKEATMDDPRDYPEKDLQKEILVQQIESLAILARQRGLPVKGFPRSELESLSVADLQVVHDGLHELTYAPPVRR